MKLAGGANTIHTTTPSRNLSKTNSKPAINMIDALYKVTDQKPVNILSKA